MFSFSSGVGRDGQQARLEGPRANYAPPGFRIGMTRALRERQLPTKRCHAALPAWVTRAYQPDSSSKPPLVSRAPAPSGNRPSILRESSHVNIDREIAGGVTTRLTAGPSISASQFPVIGEKVRVAPGDPVQNPPPQLDIHRIDVVRAEQAQFVVGDQFVPQLFEPTSGRVAVVRPEDVHHLAEASDLLVAGIAQAVEDRRHNGTKHRAVGHAVGHDLGEAALSIESDKRALPVGARHIVAGLDEPFRQGSDALCGGNDNGRLTLLKRATHEPGEGPDKHLVRRKELNDMVAWKRRAK